MKESTIYISQDSLLKNYKLLTKFAGTPVWPVLKSNAYGHGINEVVSILKKISAEYFIVQNYFEAEQIWNTLPHQNILMLGTEPFPTYNDMDFSRLTPTIGSLDLLHHIGTISGGSTSRNIQVHLKINTGMNRQGFDPQDIPQIISILNKHPHIQVVGILSHFSDADGPDVSFTHKQYECFIACVEQFKKEGIEPRWIHASNSAGLSKISPGLVNATRAGIGLYGLNPLEESDKKYALYEQLQPVLSFHTSITHVRTIKKGEVVGYGNTHQATSEQKIGTIPVGYYEGVPRIMSNVGFCSDESHTPLPIVGRVSMNLIGIDVSGTTLSVGDEVIVYSNNKLAPNTLTKNALLSKTIHYELTTNLKPHIPRIIV